MLSHHTRKSYCFIFDCHFGKDLIFVGGKKNILHRRHAIFGKMFIDSLTRGLSSTVHFTTYFSTTFKVPMRTRFQTCAVLKATAA